MMKQVLFVAVVAILAVSVSSVLLPFSGNAHVDFQPSVGAIELLTVIEDTHNHIEDLDYVDGDPLREGESSDVGTPDAVTTRSGWDVRAFYVNYDISTDTMQFGIDCYGVCGDADGDGDPNAAGVELVGDDGQTGDDVAGLANTETFFFFFDNDDNDAFFQPTFALGWYYSAEVDRGFNLYEFDPFQSFTPISGIKIDDDTLEPIVVDPAVGTYEDFFSLLYPLSATGDIVDIEFNVNGFIEKVPGYEDIIPGDMPFNLDIALFAGSYQDDGIGEDYMPGNGGSFRVTVPGCVEDECGECDGPGPDEVCGVCRLIDPDAYGQPLDECDMCFLDDCVINENGVFCYGDSKDDCDECFGPGLDECGYCSNDAEQADGYDMGLDECDLCFYDVVPHPLGEPNDPYTWGNSMDDCDECFGTGSDSCDKCPGDDGYNFPDSFAVDNCGECDGAGRDSCDLCQPDPLWGTEYCHGCDDVPFSGLTYSRCGVCDGDDSECECFFTTYKGYPKWQLDKIMTYYNTHHALWKIMDVHEMLDFSQVLLYEYEWEDDMEDEDDAPLPFCDWLETIEDFNWECLSPFMKTWSTFSDNMLAEGYSGANSMYPDLSMMVDEFEEVDGMWDDTMGDTM